MKIFSDTIVYVACPSYIATGGPELLHQLAFNLRNSGVDARMYYVNMLATKPNPVHQNYRLYDIPYETEIQDVKHNILVVPEIYYKMVYNFNQIQRGVWWLSVDSFIYWFYKILSNKLYARLYNKFVSLLCKINIINRIFGQVQLQKAIKEINKLKLLAIDHFAQCMYIADFLQRNDIKPIILSDYLREDFLIKYTDIGASSKKKDNLVVYNPKKGLIFTKQIIKYMPDTNFIPLVNLTPAEAINLLLRAKIYIDFGGHPGKDRIPREAAILGCCVITSKNGSTGFYEDVPIDSEFKLDAVERNIPLIADKIKMILNNYDDNIKKFINYQNIIRQEKNIFLDQMKRVFIKEH